MIKIVDDEADTSPGLNFVQALNFTKLGVNGTAPTTTDKLAEFREWLIASDYAYSRYRSVLDVPNELVVERLNLFQIVVTKGCLTSGLRSFDFEGAGNGFYTPPALVSAGSKWLDYFGYDTAMYNQIIFGMRSPMPVAPSTKPSNSDGTIQSAALLNAWQDEYRVLVDAWLGGEDLSHIAPTGHLLHMNTGERWGSGNDGFLQTIKGVSFISGAILKMVWIFAAYITYFFISSMTALIVRVLTSSGVVIMFPLMFCLKHIGLADNESIRILELSYPWLGLPMRAWRESGRHGSFSWNLFYPHAIKVRLSEERMIGGAKNGRIEGREERSDDPILLQYPN